MGYIYLGIAVVGELVGTNLLKASDGFTRVMFAICSLVAYILCFYFLSLSMKTVNLSVAYALWAGVGIVATTVLSVIMWHEPINWSIIIGVGLIVLGSILLNLHIE